MYPFFSGLGGYVFGTNKAGNLDPSNIGVANPTFLKNAPLIDKWNKEGLINSKVDGDTAQNAFLKKQAAFWITGPWNVGHAQEERPQVQGRPGPEDRVARRCRSSASRASWSRSTRRRTASTRWRRTSSRNYMTTPGRAAALAAANGRFPANTVAGKQVNDPVLAQFGKASKGGVPMPNIPQMASVWADLGSAWVKSTKGAGATPAARRLHDRGAQHRRQDRLDPARSRSGRPAGAPAPFVSDRELREHDRSPDPPRRRAGRSGRR